LPSSPGFAETTGVAVAMARLAFEQRPDRLGIDAVHHEQLVQEPNTDASASMFCGARGRRPAPCRQGCLQPELSDHEALWLQGRPLRHSTFAESTKS
jgi:hypothetical protein